MGHKHLLKQVAAGVLFALAVVIIMFQFTGTPLKDLVVGIFVSAIYAFLILSYVLRVAFILAGVFAVYRAVRNRVQQQVPAQG